MNLRSKTRMVNEYRLANAAGFSLMECLTYIAVFFVVLGVAFAVFFEVNDQARALTSNSADIVRAMQAGERWRADIRAATNAVQLPQNQELRLVTRHGEVSYLFRDNAIWRQGTNDRLSVLVLSPVKSSAMQMDARAQVSAWRWDIELKSKRTNSTTRPLFTFLAVPGVEVVR